MASAPVIMQLKIHVLGISPMIWRRVLVSTSITLRELHGALQVAMVQRDNQAENAASIRMRMWVWGCVERA